MPNAPILAFQPTFIPRPSRRGPAALSYPPICPTLVKRPRIRITATNSTNGVQDAPDPSSNPVAPGDPQQTKLLLLGILSSLINLDSQRGKVEQLILQLESLNATPITDAFTELSLAGHWNLLFSTAPTSAQGNIRIRHIAQQFDVQRKQLINKVRWTFTNQSTAEQLFADLVVTCSYKFVGPGRLEVVLQQHAVTILDGDDGKQPQVPSDLQALVQELQRALPVEYFDPSGLVDVSYIEPNFRLARFVSKRLAGVRNVFVRDETKSATDATS